ncbi:hypothetical protein A2706_02545 [Candidatus Peribacteria bacterium RIFCSPHIGHO2_01_FULL_51_35]|nr:MAG: hypothetical protein A2706_02545 [Candidatus Peribacteria bacterium RIFCSPHIGHO2_01_FULL_51_35]
MHRFFPSIIEPLLRSINARSLIEIGMGEGKHSHLLAAYCEEHGDELQCIDPRPWFDAATLLGKYPRVRFHKKRSIEALQEIDACDAVLIDGDHNWYTVTQELKLIEAMAKRSGKFPLVLLHDVAWPYDRRDLYYSPEEIPKEFLHPHLRAAIVPGDKNLSLTKGFNAHSFHATEEGTPRNGVLTAIEDFLKERAAQLRFITVPGFQGLGILFPLSLAEKQPPFRALIQDLERKTPLKGHVEKMEEERNKMLGKLGEHEHIVRRLQRECAEKEMILQRMRRSKSWRWTLPLRKLHKNARVIASRNRPAQTP